MKPSLPGNGKSVAEENLGFGRFVAPVRWKIEQGDGCLKYNKRINQQTLLVQL
jgi:hypothetical protein